MPFVAEVLDDLDEIRDLTNQVLEVSLSEDGSSVEIVRYSLPS
jgi:hypothetical protein